MEEPLETPPPIAAETPGRGPGGFSNLHLQLQTWVQMQQISKTHSRLVPKLTKLANISYKLRRGAELFGWLQQHVRIHHRETSGTAKKFVKFIILRVVTDQVRSPS